MRYMINYLKGRAVAWYAIDNGDLSSLLLLFLLATIMGVIFGLITGYMTGSSAVFLATVIVTVLEFPNFPDVLEKAGSHIHNTITKWERELK